MAKNRKRRRITRRKVPSAIILIELLLLTLLVVSTQAVIHLPEYASRNEPGFRVEIVRGRIEIMIVTSVVPKFSSESEVLGPSWVEPLDDAELRIGFSFSRDQVTIVGTTVTVRDWFKVGVPLWFVMLLVAAPLVWVRRAKPWQCDNCRYDLRGLEPEPKADSSESYPTTCPECGTTSSP